MKDCKIMGLLSLVLGLFVWSAPVLEAQDNKKKSWVYSGDGIIYLEEAGDARCLSEEMYVKNKIRTLLNTKYESNGQKKNKYTVFFDDLAPEDKWVAAFFENAEFDRSDNKVEYTIVLPIAQGVVIPEGEEDRFIEFEDFDYEGLEVYGEEGQLPGFQYPVVRAERINIQFQTTDIDARVYEGGVQKNAPSVILKAGEAAEAAYFVDVGDAVRQHGASLYVLMRIEGAPSLSADLSEKEWRPLLDQFRDKFPVTLSFSDEDHDNWSQGYDGWSGYPRRMVAVYPGYKMLKVFNSEGKIYEDKGDSPMMGNPNGDLVLFVISSKDWDGYKQQDKLYVGDGETMRVTPDGDGLSSKVLRIRIDNLSGADCKIGFPKEVLYEDESSGDALRWEKGGSPHSSILLMDPARL
jgi:hypothetical protein